jgi:glyoxylase-like metal-dependent hydrolase (beta-lactamase superfamily II)
VRRAAAVRRITPKLVTHVVNTHFHGDHHLGNSAFPDATIVSSERCRTQVIETGHEWVALMAHANIQNWIGTLGQVLALDASTVVPGHGELMTSADVAALQRSISGSGGGWNAPT